MQSARTTGGSLCNNAFRGCNTVTALMPKCAVRSPGGLSANEKLTFPACGLMQLPSGPVIRSLAAVEPEIEQNANQKCPLDPFDCGLRIAQLQCGLNYH